MKGDNVVKAKVTLKSILVFSFVLFWGGAFYMPQASAADVVPPESAVRSIDIFDFPKIVDGTMFRGKENFYHIKNNEYLDSNPESTDKTIT